MNPFKAYSGLCRDVYVLFFARIVNHMGNFVYVFLTLFLTQKMGYSKETAGIYVMLCSLMPLIGTMVGGKIGDHFGRKNTMLTFFLISAILKGTCGFLSISLYIPVLVVISSFFMGGIGPLNRAIVMDLTSGESRKKAISLMYLGLNFGAAIGPLLAGFLFEKYTSWIFWGDCLTSFVAILMIFFYVNESLPTEEQINDEESIPYAERAEKGTVIDALLKRPVLIIFGLLGLLVNSIYAQHSFAIPLQLDEIFVGKGAQVFGYMMSFNAFIVIIFTTFLLELTKKNQAINNVVMGAVFYGIGFGMLCFVNSIFLLMISVFIWTIGEILFATNYFLYTSNHSPITHRGRFNAIFMSTWRGGYALGPLLSGFFISRYNIRLLWIICLITAGILAVAYYFLGLLEKKQIKKVSFEEN
ncbi:MAG: MFS transporter [Spirochaetes bacterium]|nr:MFS transporter [Spirochaetota bacterium]